MGVLERIFDLQNQGFTNEEIAQQLRNDGASPKEIQEAFNQASVKTAISSPSETDNYDYQNPQYYPQDQNAPPQDYSQIPQPTSEQYPPQENQYPPSQTQYPPAPNPEIYEAPKTEPNYYSQVPQAYSGQEYYPPSQGPSTETVSEIVEQLMSEKLEEWNKVLKQIQNLQEVMKEKIDDTDYRLKRLETSMDKLQHSVIGKIGEFGSDAALIHKDLDSLHGTVSKLMDPLIDNINALKKKSKE